MPTHMSTLRVRIFTVALTALLVPACGSSQSGRSHPGLHVSGNRIVDGSGHTVALHGVNRSGSEYSCIQNAGIFDGPSDGGSVAAMAAWHVNIVRVPLNEDCWLGINVGGVNPAYVGRHYVHAIVAYVKRLHAHGMYAELSLMWGAPGTAKATFQPNAPDKDHSPTMWASMARTFQNDPNVILAPWGETQVGWSCFRNGCSDQSTWGWNVDNLPSCRSGCWFVRSAGMQQAVDVMRQNSYHGPIAIPCIDYANACGVLPDGTKYNGSTWVQSKPVDPDRQLIAEAHVYGKNMCDTAACFDSSMKPILQAGYPVIWGETGETYDASDCGSSQISKLLDWADAHGVGYEAWTWDTWGNCSALINDYAGTPNNGYGRYIRDHYVAAG